MNSPSETSHDKTAEEDSSEQVLRDALKRNVSNWAQNRGLLALLTNLESVSWPHIFAVPEYKARSAEKTLPWVPLDFTDKSITAAYKKATLQLHPDRLRDRDMSIRVEAEEILKVLTLAHADQETWRKTADICPPSVDSNKMSRSSEVPSAGDRNPSFSSGLRDELFADLNKNTPSSREESVETARCGQQSFLNSIFGDKTEDQNPHAKREPSSSRQDGNPFADAASTNPFDSPSESKNPF